MAPVYWQSVVNWMNKEILFLLISVHLKSVYMLPNNFTSTKMNCTFTNPTKTLLECCLLKFYEMRNIYQIVQIWELLLRMCSFIIFLFLKGHLCGWYNKSEIIKWFTYHLIHNLHNNLLTQIITELLFSRTLCWQPWQVRFDLAISYMWIQYSTTQALRHCL